jgi:hypothetical protein
MNKITMMWIPTKSNTCRYVKISIKWMEPTFANNAPPAKTFQSPTSIAHQPIMQVSTPGRDKRLLQSSMLMMTIPLQKMTINQSALFVIIRLYLSEMKDMLIQKNNALANITIITIV